MTARTLRRSLEALASATMAAQRQLDQVYELAQQATARRVRPPPTSVRR